MVCSGVEPGAAGLEVQSNPLSYGGTPSILFSTCFLLSFAGEVLLGQLRLLQELRLLRWQLLRDAVLQGLHGSTLHFTHGLSSKCASPTYS